MGPVAQQVFKTCAVWQPHARSVRLRRRSVLCAHDRPPPTHTAVGPNSALDVQATGRGGVPSSGVSAVVINLTATEPTAGSYLTAFPTGSAVPLASNLNFGPGQTVPNLVVVKLASGGKFSVYNAQGNTHVIADVVGWY